MISRETDGIYVAVGTSSMCLRKPNGSEKTVDGTQNRIFRYKEFL